MFYAVAALALKHKFETSKHTQLIGWFNKEFVKTGVYDAKYGKILRNSYQKRTKGDYDVFVKFEKDEVIGMRKDLVEFLNVIKTHIEEN